MKRVVLITLTLLALAPSSASAVELVDASGAPLPYPFQRWADTPALKYPGVVVVSPSDHNAGTYGEATPRIWIDCRRSEDEGFTRGYGCRRALLHELGHVTDDKMLNDRNRATFGRIVGDTSRESIAEAYRMCALYPHGGIDWQREFSVGYFPTRRQHVAVCGLFRWIQQQYDRKADR